MSQEIEAEVEGWTGTLRSDGAKVVMFKGGEIGVEAPPDRQFSHYEYLPEGRSVLLSCPHCQRGFATERAAKLAANALCVLIPE